MFPIFHRSPNLCRPRFEKKRHLNRILNPESADWPMSCPNLVCFDPVKFDDYFTLQAHSLKLLHGTSTVRSR